MIKQAPETEHRVQQSKEVNVALKKSSEGFFSESVWPGINEVLDKFEPSRK